MKRKIAIVLSILLMVASLAGCSQAERGYLDMCRQISAVTEARVTGSLEAEIDFDALAALADRTAAKIAGPDGYYLGSEVKDEFAAMGLKGTKKIKLTYEILANATSGAAFQANLDVELNGKAYDLGDVYFDGAQGVFFSKEFLIGIYDLYREFSLDGPDSYFYTEEYRDDLMKALGNHQYVSSASSEDGSLEGILPVNMNAVRQEINEAAYEFIETAFSGFTTGTISQTGGGYRLSLNGQQVKKLIPDLLQYLVDNTGKAMEAYQDYTAVILQGAGALTEEELSSANAGLDELFGQNSQMMVASFLAGTKQMFIEADKAGYLDFLDGFQFETTVKKSGDKWTASEELYLRDRNKTVFSLKNRNETSAQPVTVQLPEATMSAADLSAAIAALENKYNPVIEAELSWWNDDYEDPTVWIEYKRGGESPISSASEVEFEPYFIKEKRLYVPMRSISEALGEEVTWDQKAKKAYVVRSGEKIELSGILKGGRTYIKVIDFEKLGYKVTYEYDKEWGEHLARIFK